MNLDKKILDMQFGSRNMVFPHEEFLTEQTYMNLPDHDSLACADNMSHLRPNTYANNLVCADSQKTSRMQTYVQ